MNTASLHEIKKELHTLDPEKIASFCMQLAKYKKENKELLTYLLFEAHNEQNYIVNVKEAVDDLFTELPSRNLYIVKKMLRKILRFVNRQIKYSGIKQTEVELRIYFCFKVKGIHIPLTAGTVLGNLYQQQLKKIHGSLAKMPEDLQADYQRDVENL
jgi:hypothetical protein